MVSARRCFTCKVLFESIDALNDHCTLNAHWSGDRCRPCGRAFATTSGLQSHLGSRLHTKHSRAKISARDIDGRDETQTAPTTITANKLSTPDSRCSRCELTFNNHELLLEHYRTSSMHRFCLVCFMVFPSKELLDQHMGALRHLKNRVLSIPKSKKSKNKKNRKKPIPPSSVSRPAVLHTEPTPQLEKPTCQLEQSTPQLKLFDDDFVLVEKPLLLLPPPTQTPATLNYQPNNSDAALPAIIKCPGCQKIFQLFFTFVRHIEMGECSSTSKARQIDGEINALAAQLFSNLSMI